MLRSLEEMLGEVFALIEIKGGLRPFEWIEPGARSQELLNDDKLESDFQRSYRAELYQLRTEIFGRVSAEVLQNHLDGIGNEFRSLWLKVIEIDRRVGEHRLSSPDQTVTLRYDGSEAEDALASAHMEVLGTTPTKVDRAFWAFRCGPHASLKEYRVLMKKALTVRDPDIWVWLGLENPTSTSLQRRRHHGPLRLVLGAFRHFSGVSISAISALALLRQFLGQRPNGLEILWLVGECVPSSRRRASLPFRGLVLLRSALGLEARYTDDEILSDILLLEKAMRRSRSEFMSSPLRWQ